MHERVVFKILMFAHDHVSRPLFDLTQVPNLQRIYSLLFYFKALKSRHLPFVSTIYIFFVSRKAFTYIYCLVPSTNLVMGFIVKDSPNISSTPRAHIKQSSSQYTFYSFHRQCSLVEATWFTNEADEEDRALVRRLV